MQINLQEIKQLPHEVLLVVYPMLEYGQEYRLTVTIHHEDKISVIKIYMQQSSKRFEVIVLAIVVVKFL